MTTANDCTARALMVPAHLSSSGRAMVAVCDSEHDESQAHFGQTHEVDGDEIIETFPTVVSWSESDRRCFHRPDDLAKAYEPPMCDRPDGGHHRCCLPARHRGRCAP